MPDELEMLLRYREEPVPASAERRAAARRELQRAIAHERMAIGPASGRRPALPRPSRLLPAFALGLAALVAVVVMRSGSTTAPALAAGPVLERLARVAAAQPNDVPGPGQFLYTASRSLGETDTVLRGGFQCREIYSEYRQNWIAPNGEGFFRETDGPVHLASATEAARCKALPTQRAGTSNTWAAAHCLSISPVPLTRLSRDPGELRAHLLTGKVEGGPPGPAEAFAQVGDLLRETDASPALRSVLYRAAAGLPGVKFLGTIKDHSGRSGLGLAIDSHGIRHELIFSASTSALLSEQGISVGRVQGLRTHHGTLLYWSVYTGGSVVDRLPQRSPLPLSPACVKGGGRSHTVPGNARDSVIIGAIGK